MVLVAVAPSLVAGAWLLASGLGVTQQPGPAPEPTPFTVSGQVADPAEALVRDEQSAPQLAPDRLAIPSLGIEAPLVPGTISRRSLEIPDDPATLTLYEGGGEPCGTTGTVLAAGHVVSRGTRGALWPLHRIEPRATAWLSCGDGALTTWRVVGVEVTRKRDLPQDVFDRSGPRRLVVVTCGGPVMPDGHYRDNVIVHLAPVGG